MGSRSLAAEPVSMGMSRIVPLQAIIFFAIFAHLPLLLMQWPNATYDANLHKFLASHYAANWFDPWNVKWYAGFSQTSYPPLEHQWIALFSHVVGLDWAYMIVQLAAIILLPLGVYRYSLIWVGQRAALYAATGSVLIGALSFLIYDAGQLPTTLAAPLYLNALPFVYEWCRRGTVSSLFKGLSLILAAASAHHTTLIFGGVLFMTPVLIKALISELPEMTPQKRSGILAREAILSIAAILGILVVLGPFWIAMLHNPLTQSPIPHPSRENYLSHLEWGVHYFLVPWGALLIGLPLIFARGIQNKGIRPLFWGFWITFILGLGGTTPLPRLILFRFFYILTFERFTFWAQLMALPIIGLIAVELVDRYGRKAAIFLAVAGCLTMALNVSRPVYQAHGKLLSIDEIAAFLSSGDHAKYRYLTLGFSDAKADELSMRAPAAKIDGNYHSARMLPELTAYGIGSLNNAKYFGNAGIASLRAVLAHAEKYGLRYIFVQDTYYEPLLQFAGWKRTGFMDGENVSVWEHEVAAARPLEVGYRPGKIQGILWGILPIGSSVLALLLVGFSAQDSRFNDSRAVTTYVSTPKSHGLLVFVIVLTLALIGIGQIHLHAETLDSPGAAIVQEMFRDVQSGSFAAAYSLVAQPSRTTLQDFARELRGQNGSLRTYSHLEGVSLQVLKENADNASVLAQLAFSSPIGQINETREFQVTHEQSGWRVAWPFVTPVTVPPQVVPVYFRKWLLSGGESSSAPTTRQLTILSRNVLETPTGVAVCGEIENDDTVPLHSTVWAVAIGEQNRQLDEEDGLDMMVHNLLPGQRSPYRVDFPNLRLSKVQDIQLNTRSMAITASTDPYIEVVNPKPGRYFSAPVIQGTVVNHSGRGVNIVHVLGAVYDEKHRVIWIGSTYLDRELAPTAEQAFTIVIPESVASRAQGYSIAIDHFNLNE